MSTHWDEKIAGFLAQQQRDRELYDEMDGITEQTWMEMVESGEVRFKDQTIVLENKSLFDNKLQIRLPKDLTSMPKGMLEREGKPRNRDQYLFVSDQEELACGLNWMEQAETAADLEILKTCMMIESKGKKPEIRLFELEDEALKEMNIETYDCLVPTEQGQIYQLIFLTLFRERVLMGTFQFKAEHATLWRPLSAAIIQSVQFT
ncbi:hypothetical protein [Paenibacillus glacialis]|uniref:Uncharacterized protein n=1 Tax=Paenibacillus glacialis TaxID=494026 RepID=A0A168F7B7_9BACL|nr:hypothetical protein [Paenibacillus glacialis]OAB35932.1 hypothetical protein PGLA_21115 [Paenibacillus glacialis]